MAVMISAEGTQTHCTADNVHDLLGGYRAMGAAIARRISHERPVYTVKMPERTVQHDNGEPFTVSAYQFDVILNLGQRDDFAHYATKGLPRSSAPSTRTP